MKNYLFITTLLLFTLPAFAGTVFNDSNIRIDRYDDRSGSPSFALEYRGYLTGTAAIGDCRPDFVNATDLVLSARIDNGEFKEVQLTRSCGALSGRFGANFLRQAPRGEHTVEFFLRNSRGQYDSAFGENYRFRYRY